MGTSMGVDDDRVRQVRQSRRDVQKRVQVLALMLADRQQLVAPRLSRIELAHRLCQAHNLCLGRLQGLLHAALKLFCHAGVHLSGLGSAAAFPHAGGTTHVNTNQGSTTPKHPRPHPMPNIVQRNTTHRTPFIHTGPGTRVSGVVLATAPPEAAGAVLTCPVHTAVATPHSLCASPALQQALAPLSLTKHAHIALRTCAPAHEVQIRHEVPRLAPMSMSMVEGPRKWA